MLYPTSWVWEALSFNFVPFRINDLLSQGSTDYTLNLYSKYHMWINTNLFLNFPFLLNIICHLCWNKCLRNYEPDLKDNIKWHHF